jgi:hypothetical protein
LSRASASDSWCEGGEVDGEAITRYPPSPPAVVVVDDAPLPLPLPSPTASGFVASTFSVRVDDVVVGVLLRALFSCIALLARLCGEENG